MILNQKGPVLFQHSNNEVINIPTKVRKLFYNTRIDSTHHGEMYHIASL